MLKFYFYNFSSQTSAESMISQINDMCEKTKHLKRMEDIMLFVCVPTASLEMVCKSIEDRELVKISSQCFSAANISGMPTAKQLVEIGAHMGLTGLTDRRFLLGETDEFCRDGLGELLSLGKKALLCVGETKQIKDSGTARQEIAKQVTTGVSKVPMEAVYRMGILYRPLWEFEGEKTDLAYALDMIDVIKQASNQALPELPEPLPVFYGGEVSTQQLKELFDKQQIDGIFVDQSRMTAEEFVKMINDIGA